MSYSQANVFREECIRKKHDFLCTLFIDSNAAVLNGYSLAKYDFFHLKTKIKHFLAMLPNKRWADLGWFFFNKKGS